jgi:hypothetical protein
MGLMAMNVPLNGGLRLRLEPRGGKMGYRSEVAFTMEKEDFINMCQDPDIYEWVEAADSIEESKGIVVAKYEHVKWYTGCGDDYIGLDKIEDRIKKLCNEKLDYPGGLIRIGEELEDVETIGNWWHQLSYIRRIETPNGKTFDLTQVSKVSNATGSQVL